MRNPLADDLDHVLAQTRGLWQELRGGRVFLTGGTGFFGCWLLESFLWANDHLKLGASIVVLTRNADAFARKAPHLASHAAVTLRGGDVRTFTLADTTFSHVIHAATDSGVPLEPRGRPAMFETLVDGTRRTLEFARQTGATRFLLTSSGAVYGNQPAELTHIPEDHAGGPDPANPAAVYAEGKRAAEMLCALYADANLQPTIARCFAFVGPYLPLEAHFAVGNFLRDALRGGPIRVGGDGTPYRSYLYGADLAIWLWTILLRGESMRPYNVGSAAALTIGELARTVADTLGPAIDVEITHQAVSGTPAGRYVPDVRRAEQELGLRTTVPLSHGIRRTAAWHTALGEPSRLHR